MRALLGLDDFGLNKRSFWKLNPKTVVRVRIDVPYPDVRRFFKLHPDQRAQRIRESMERSRRRLVSAWPEGAAPIIGRSETGRAHFLRGKLQLSSLRRLTRHLSIGTIWIESIGRRARRIRQRREFTWHVVVARFALQVEDQTSGLQDFEDRTVIVKAWSSEDAVRRLRKPFQQYGKPYLNTQHRMVRWKFETVLQSFEMRDPIDPRETEVTSRFGSRRMKKAFEWHPRRK